MPIPGFSKTTTKIQGLSRGWKFFPPIPGLSRIFKDRGNPDIKRVATIEENIAQRREALKSFNNKWSCILTQLPLNDI